MASYREEVKEILERPVSPGSKIRKIVCVPVRANGGTDKYQAATLVLLPLGDMSDGDKCFFIECLMNSRNPSVTLRDILDQEGRNEHGQLEASSIHTLPLGEP